MKRFAGTVLLVCILGGGTYAVVDNEPPPKPTVPEDSPAIPKRDNGDIPPRAGAPGEAEGSLARKHRIPEEITQEHAIRHKWLRPGGVASGHGIAP